MFIGHLPAGYVATRLLYRRFARTGVMAKYFMLAGMFGAIAPDLDMFYFYLIDNRQHHHHTYWPHYPVIWFSLLAATSLWFGLARNKARAALGLVFTLNGCLHMLLDSIVGDVWWLAPWVDQPYVLFTVQAVYTPWWLNFILHWSFALELALLAWAIYLWRCKPVEAPASAMPGADNPLD
ncbi:metal-dependent hydrolase [Halopseudomonas sabulinigri]|uniref:Metal-dependent hydrolase n=1 Tax=Halopseudomonas sabulinigri TaxID=472181 RepID=A0ABP9ZRL9_9GAMM